MRPDTPATDEAERLKVFISSIADYAIYMLTPEGNVASWNLGAERFKGYSPAEIIGQHFSRFYTEEDRQAGVPRQALATAESAGKFEAEGWRVRKDGTRFWASVVIDPIRDEHGSLIGFAKITRDITEKRAAERALRAQEELFRVLVQGVTDYAIYMLSPAGEVSNWNAGARRIKGYLEEEVLGTHFSRFYTPHDREQGLPARALHTAAEHGRYETEAWRVRKDGTQFWAHVVIDAIRSEQGELIGFAKVTRDLTERRNAEADLASAREALFHSQKMEAIGKLTGGVAHDFNNLLNVVTSGIGILRRKIVDPDLLRNLDTMEQASARGASLTNQLLSFARQQPLRPESRDLNRLIQGFQSILRRALSSKVGLEFDLHLDVPRIMIDATQLESALLNLVVNSGDATGDGGQVTVSTRMRQLREREVGALAAGTYVALVVQDTGSGMTPEVIVRAVEPFFTTKPVGKGTGLGLSQVYGLTQQSGGDITIDSHVGTGTAITLYFPALGAEPKQASEMRALDVERALVVDDHPEVLEMTVEIMRTLGYEVLSASSGENALNVLKEHGAVDVLVTDVMMPGMTGVDLARRTRAESPTTRILLASGFTDLGTELDDFDFLAKPYQISDIAKKLRQLQ